MLKILQITHILVLLCTLGRSEISNGSQEVKVCPPKGAKFDCYCNESKKILDCPLNIPNKLPWVMKTSFDTISILVPDVKSIVYEKLEISGAPLGKGSPLKMDEDSITSLRFREIVIFSFDTIEYIHPNALPGTYDTTERFKMSDHLLKPLSSEIFQFFANFRVLKTLILSRVAIPVIPKYAFANGQSQISSVEVIDILNGNVERIHPFAFAGCSNLQKLDLQHNKLTAEGIAVDAFSGISQNAEVNLMNNAGLTHLPREKFQPFLDSTNGNLSVGTWMESGSDTQFYLHCDYRANWICAKNENLETHPFEYRYKTKLFGYRCKEDEYEDVFDYCDAKEAVLLGTTTPEASASAVSASVLFLFSALLLIYAFNSVK